MKVALVFTGLLRGFESAYPAFKQYVLDRYDTDVYFDIWSEVGWYSGKGYIPTNSPFIKTQDGERGFHTSGERVNANRIMEVYNPVSLRIDNYDLADAILEEGAKAYPNALTRPKNTLAQALKIWMAMDSLVDGSDKYDLVVRSRPDIVLEHDPGQFTPTEFLTLPSRNSRGEGTGDSIQIGSYKDICRYSELFDVIPELYEEIGYSCPHAYAERWIRKNRFNWREMPIGAHVSHSPSGIPYKEPE
jgi:hypothetical protein